MFKNKDPKQFQLVDGGFEHNGEFHKLIEIKHIFYSLVHTTQRTNFIKVGSADSAYLHLTLDSGKTIKLEVDEATWFHGINRNKQAAISSLQKLYVALCESTFRNRLARYINEVEVQGYFVYDECRFYPSEKKIVFRNKTFHRDSTTFKKEGWGVIGLSKKEPSFLDKVKEQTSLAKSPQFNTQTDTDVIFLLLDKYFGLRWRKR